MPSNRAGGLTRTPRRPRSSCRRPIQATEVPGPVPKARSGRRSARRTHVRTPTATQARDRSPTCRRASRRQRGAVPRSDRRRRHSAAPSLLMMLASRPKHRLQPEPRRRSAQRGETPAVYPGVAARSSSVRISAGIGMGRPDLSSDTRSVRAVAKRSRDSAFRTR